MEKLLTTPADAAVVRAPTAPAVVLALSPRGLVIRRTLLLEFG